MVSSTQAPDFNSHFLFILLWFASNTNQSSTESLFWYENEEVDLLLLELLVFEVESTPEELLTSSIISTGTDVLLRILSQVFLVILLFYKVTKRVSY
jgi:hypothetical protein